MEENKIGQKRPLNAKFICYNNAAMKSIKVFILFFSIVFYPWLTYSAESEVEMMLNRLHWLGHASFRLEASKIIYFDPWKLSKNAPKADVILITHEHYDHFSPEDIQKISTPNTVIVTDTTVSRRIESESLTYKEVRRLLPGEASDISGIKIEGVASYNTNKQYHTKTSKKLGFIVTIDGMRIYDAGDTDMIPEMKDYSCDIAILPVSGTYVMTADEAALAALLIKPKVAIPSHYADIVGNAKDASRFQELLKDKVEVKILNKES
jgi:L-ascorbate metabolism protein UlaG (beta-lactamase superfamily)